MTTLEDRSVRNNYPCTNLGVSGRVVQQELFTDLHASAVQIPVMLVVSINLSAHLPAKSNELGQHKHVADQLQKTPACP